MYANMEFWSEIRRRVLTGEMSKREACVGGGSKVQRRGGRKCSAIGMKFTGRRCPL